MEIKNIKRLDDNKFEIRFSYIDQLTGKRRRIRRRIEGTVADAIGRRDQLKQHAKNGELEMSWPSDKPLNEWVDEYVEHKRVKGLRASSVSEIETALGRVMKTDAADWRPEHVEAHHVDQWTDDRLRQSDLSPATISKRQGYLKRLIKFARKRLGLGVGFLRDVESVQGSTKRRGNALTPEQARAFLSEMRQRYPHHYALSFILLATGQRWGAVTALRWCDMNNDWLVFNRTHYRGEIDTGSKTGKTIRVPKTDAISEVLEWHHQWMLENQHPNIDHPDGLVFPTSTPATESTTNGYRTSTDIQYAFRTVCKQAEIPRITPHDLRRTFNTWASEKVSGTIVRSLTGHSSAGMTDHYYHGSKEAKGEVIDTVTDLIDTP